MKQNGSILQHPKKTIQCFTKTKEPIFKNQKNSYSKELSPEQFVEIMRESLGVYVHKDHNQIEITKRIVDFYYKYPNIQDRPLFIDIDI